MDGNESIVSIVNANTVVYKDKVKIKRAVLEALERINAKDCLHPGQTVLIKPNLVMDKNHDFAGGIACLYTQPEVIDPVVGFVCECLQGEGRIIIGDAPMQECVFENIKGLQQIVEKYKDAITTIELVDFRELKSRVENVVHKTSINPNANGRVVDLGKDSLFYGMSEESLANMRITNYDPRILPRHHTGMTHEYYVSQYVLDADVIINMPKPKSHRKAGVTISLKNFVGANTRKEFLPHHTMGSIKNGGDEYLKTSAIHALRSRLFDAKNTLEAGKKYKRAQMLGVIILGLSAILKFTGHSYAEGSWYGNDTISKTISDLNRIVLFANREGTICKTRQRDVLIVADMIVCGEREGPVAPSPKNVGIIAAGTNAVCFDETICTLMGFDYHKIPSIVRARDEKHRLSISDYKVPIISSNIPGFDGRKPEQLGFKDLKRFEPTAGWKGHIELVK